MPDDLFTIGTKLRFYHSCKHGSFVCVESMASALEEVAAKHVPSATLILQELATALRRTALRSQNASLKED